jgi:hypothetical protein
MLRAAAANSWRQLLTFSAGSDFGNNSNADDYINLVLHRFFPSEEGQFLASWQQRGAPDLAAINFIYALVVVASLVGTVVILAISGFPAGLTEFSLVVAVGIVANAFVTGALSGVYDRYQARIIWLVPFVFATSVAVSLRRQLPAHQASAG